MTGGLIDGRIESVPFNRFTEVVRKACGGASSWEAPRPVTYLRSYLAEHQVGAATLLLIEPGYLDRHYLQEYASYYATRLKPPPPSAVRLHAFTDRLGQGDIDAALRTINTETYGRVSQLLRESYLGYITIRPLPSAPIGRTVLRHYGETAERRYDPASSAYHAHVLGFDLEVDSLPCHQQEQAVGACATAALWAALSRAARAAGARTPTPFSVTTAATKHLVTDRDVPALGGLELSQLTGAIREFGFSPYTIKTRADFNAFTLTLKCYLRSGIPAVLMLQEGDEYHAVTVAGYKAPPGNSVVVEANGIGVQSGGITRLYVHDDRIGPYVKMRVKPTSDEMDLPHLTRVPVDVDKESEQDPSSRITHAIFPLYPKLRLTAPELISLAGQTSSLLRMVVGARRDELRFECWFVMNGAYLQELWSLDIDPPDRPAAFLRTARLSRYVGIIRWFLGDHALADIICDTTDIARTAPQYGEVLAIVCFLPSLVPEVQAYAADLMPRAIIV